MTEINVASFALSSQHFTQTTDLRNQRLVALWILWSGPVASDFWFAFNKSTPKLIYHNLYRKKRKYNWPTHLRLFGFDYREKGQIGCVHCHVLIDFFWSQRKLVITSIMNEWSGRFKLRGSFRLNSSGRSDRFRSEQFSSSVRCERTLTCVEEEFGRHVLEKHPKGWKRQLTWKLTILCELRDKQLVAPSLLQTLSHASCATKNITKTTRPATKQMNLETSNGGSNNKIYGRVSYDKSVLLDASIVIIFFLKTKWRKWSNIRIEMLSSEFVVIWKANELFGQPGGNGPHAGKKRNVSGNRASSMARSNWTSVVKRKRLNEQVLAERRAKLLTICASESKRLVVH